MKPRIGIVGANGRLGAELALRLSSVDDFSVIGVCRNRSGSAFLRLNGVECRHGAIEDSTQAHWLVGDCDVVVQLAYRVPRTRSGSAANRAVVRNCVLNAPAHSHLILASTIMVYGPDAPLPVPDVYGLEKRLLEKCGQRWAKQCGRRTTILRMGHALGALQPLSLDIYRANEKGTLALPYVGGRPSNTLFVASLAEVVVRATRQELPSGTFDLISSPQWTWERVFRFHANQRGIDLQITPSAERTPLRAIVRSRVHSVLLLMPDRFSEWAYGRYLRWAASRPAPMQTGREVTLATTWRGVGHRPLHNLSAPEDAMAAYPLPNPDALRAQLPAEWSMHEFDAVDKLCAQDDSYR
jgi:nucleoside-diphosphate-sugar epimerase